MKRFLFSLLILTPFVISAQENDSKNENNVFVNMSLESILECTPTSQYEVLVCNTVDAILTFCEKIIKIPPGVHKVKIDIINETCHLIMIEDDKRTDFAANAISMRIIKDGIQEVSYYSSEDSKFPPRDYIEYTVCDYYIFRLSVQR